MFYEEPGLVAHVIITLLVLFLLHLNPPGVPQGQKATSPHGHTNYMATLKSENHLMDF